MSVMLVCFMVSIGLTVHRKTQLAGTRLGLRRKGVESLTSLQRTPDSGSARVAFSLPENSRAVMSREETAPLSGRDDQERSKEDREEMATPFHTARIQVKGLLKEADHAIRLVWIRVVINCWMTRTGWLNPVAKEKGSGTNPLFCVAGCSVRAVSREFAGSESLQTKAPSPKPSPAKSCGPG